MYWLDFVLLLVLGIGAFLGARSGLLWQVARIVTFVLAVYACIRYHGVVAGVAAEEIAHACVAAALEVDVAAGAAVCGNQAVEDRACRCKHGDASGRGGAV